MLILPTYRKSVSLNLCAFLHIWSCLLLETLETLEGSSHFETSSSVGSRCPCFLWRTSRCLLPGTWPSVHTIQARQGDVFVHLHKPEQTTGVFAKTYGIFLDFFQKSFKDVSFAQLFSCFFFTCISEAFIHFHICLNVFNHFDWYVHIFRYIYIY